METTIKNKKSTSPVYFAIISSILIVFGILFFIFHISPEKIAMELSEFAQHHYFLMSFISFVSGMIFLKFYYDRLKRN
jgi:hypothetical protein